MEGGLTRLNVHCIQQPNNISIHYLAPHPRPCSSSEQNHPRRSRTQHPRGRWNSWSHEPDGLPTGSGQKTPRASQTTTRATDGSASTRSSSRNMCRWPPPISPYLNPTGTPPPPAPRTQKVARTISRFKDVKFLAAGNDSDHTHATHQPESWGRPVTSPMALSCTNEHGRAQDIG